MDLNFDLGANNEFMDLLDMAHPELGTDENGAQYDFSSLKPLPDDFLGFDFDSDAADRWPTLTTDVDSSYDFCKSRESPTPNHSAASMVAWAGLKSRKRRLLTG